MAQLNQRGRITEVVDTAMRYGAIARASMDEPAKALIISPDNASRRELNQAVRQALRSEARLGTEDVHLKVLTPRQDMTGADRNWASRYQADEVLRYSVGSKTLVRGIAL